ncbi:MAG: 30S ribosome-binding factor RbfA [Gammaproteobacteria bacterium]
MADATRVKRLAGEISQELALLIRAKLNDKRLGMVTVTGVKVSKDLGYADIYVTFLAASDDMTSESCVAILRKASGFLRTELSKQLKVRSTPLLRFHFDEVNERGFRLDRLIQEAKASRPSSV